MDEEDVASPPAPSKLQQWRLIREEQMRAQVEKERARKASLAKAARADLDRTYQSRTQQVQDRHELNVELEQQFIAERDEPIKKSWPKVVKIALGSDQTKPVRKKSVLQPADVLRSSDKARFREVLHRLAARDGQQNDDTKASSQSFKGVDTAVIPDPIAKSNGSVSPSLQHTSAALIKTNAAELTSASPPQTTTVTSLLQGQASPPEQLVNAYPTPIAPVPPLASTAQHEEEDLYHPPSPSQEQSGAWAEDGSIPSPVDDSYRETLTLQNGYLTPSKAEQDNLFAYESTPVSEQTPSPSPADKEAMPTLPVSPKPSQAEIAAQLEEKRAELERLKQQSGRSRDKVTPNSNISPGWSGHLIPEDTESPKHQVLKPRHVKAAGGVLFTAKTPQQLDEEINSLQRQVRELERQHAQTEQ